MRVLLCFFFESFERFCSFCTGGRYDANFDAEADLADPKVMI
jgi:hypothetical protein